MELENLSLAVLFIGICSIAYFGIFAYTGFNDVRASPDTSFNSTFNKLNGEVTRINETSNQIFSTGTSTEFSFVPTIQGVFGTASVLLGSLGVLKQMIYQLSVYLGVPTYIVVAIGGILTALFVFAVIKITMRVTKA